LDLRLDKVLTGLMKAFAGVFEVVDTSFLVPGDGGVVWPVLNIVFLPVFEEGRTGGAEQRPFFSCDFFLRLKNKGMWNMKRAVRSRGKSNWLVNY
jgi:hypothetical protein